MAGNIKGIIVEIGGDTSGLQKALSKVNSATSSLSKELRGVNSLLKLDPSNMELLSQKQNILKKNIEETTEKLAELKEIQEQADSAISNGTKVSDENYRALQREIINTENKLKQLQVEASNWTKAGRKIEEIGIKIEGIGSRVESLGNKLTKIFSVTIVTGTVAAIKSAVDFESAFTGVEKTVNGTKEQMEELKEGIKKMSREIPSTTTEIAAVAEAAGQLGIQTDNILEFSKAMLDLGNSTNLTAEEAATQLARFANITQMSQKDFNKLGSAIVDLGNNFATTESEIVNMSMRLAGAGHQVGFSEGQILGLATALSSVGVEAEMGGSAISKAMVKMQNAVEMGGSKLNVVLKKTGMTLRKLELMSANDSKGFKELSQSIGMTSTEVKQLLTAGTNLEDFAKISGMTAKKFKKEWKDDAAGALTAFIKGLGDAESKGESAITMLSEMGLTEVRLRDSLLRAANAGNLLSDAIKTGTDAFEENTALTNEANKRYQTLESRLKTTKNKIVNVATSLGNKLTPSINKILDKSDKFIDKLDNMNEEETKNIIKTGLMLAAVGPLVKVLGKTITITGKTAKGIGIFSQAIAVATNKTTSNITSVNNLAKAFSALTSPTGLLIASFAATTTAAVLYEQHQQEMLGNSAEVKKAIDEEVKSREALIERQNESISGNLSEINRSQELYNELKAITDENGKIKKGYEKRANYITNQLSEALGIEIKINNGVIDSYKEIQNEIDKTILKKKGEAIVSGQEDSYNEALRKRGEAYSKLNELEKKYQEAYLKSKNFDMDAKLAADSLFQQVQKQRGLIAGYNTDIATYEKNYSLLIENTSESLNELVRRNEVGMSNQTTNTYDEVTKQIDYYSQLVTDYKRLKDNQLQAGNSYRAKEYEQQEESNRKQLTQLANQLSEITTTTNINEPAIQEAWKKIANNSSVSFFEIISKMPEEIQEELLKITGVINKDSSVHSSMKNLAKDAERGFNDNVDGKKWGNDLTKEMSSSMTSKSSKNRISGASSTVASWISQYLHFSLPDKGPLSDMDKSMPDMIELMANGLNNNKSKLLNATQKLAQEMNDNLLNQSLFRMTDFEKMQGKINNQVIDSTKTVFTTPTLNIYAQEELTPAKLNSIVDTVNKRLGSQY